MRKHKLLNIKFLLTFFFFVIYTFPSFAQFNCLTRANYPEAKRYLNLPNKVLQITNESFFRNEKVALSNKPKTRITKRRERINNKSYFNNQKLTFLVDVYINIEYINGNEKKRCINLLTKANNLFSSSKIGFALNSVTIIGDTLNYVFYEKNENKFCKHPNYNKKNICIYIFEEVLRDKNVRNAGYAKFPWDKKLNNILIIDQSIFYDETGNDLTHELGHFFGLFHTHETWDKEITSELVDGSNSKITGDFISDTPADPNLINEGSVDNCKYIGNLRDKKGLKYQPLVNNIMSYAPKECRTNFTYQQINVMRYFALTMRSNLQKQVPDINADSQIIKNGWNLSTTIPNIIEDSYNTLPKKVLIFVFNNDFTWCTRMYNEMIENYDINTLFKNSYTLLKFDVKYRNTNLLINTFLGNTLYRKKKKEYIKLELFFKSYINDLTFDFTNKNSHYFSTRNKRISIYKPKYKDYTKYFNSFNKEIYFKKSNYTAHLEVDKLPKLYYNTIVPAIIILDLDNLNSNKNVILDIKLGYQKDYEIIELLKKHLANENL